MKTLIALALILFSTPTFADEVGVYSDPETGSGFVAIEGGYWRISGSGRQVVTDPIMFYLTIGVSLTKAFFMDEDYEPLKIGPKIGVGFGHPRTPGADSDYFADVLVKVRYALGPADWVARPFISAGPGYNNYN